MQLTAKSEWMKDQRHAEVMGPGTDFQVIQTQGGHSIFFSLGTDRVLYATREVLETATGWSKVDLTSVLASRHGNAALSVKSFCVSQNLRTLAFDLATVLTVGGIDYLYLSMGNANTDTTWSTGIAWTAIPFDDTSRISGASKLVIADIYLMNLSANERTAAQQTCFVDIWRSPTAKDPLGLVDRYYINTNGTPRWKRHTLAIDLAAGSITSCLGQRARDPISGIYTFGTIGGTQELIYAMQYNVYRPNNAPLPARLNVPIGATSISSALDENGHSNLFISAGDGIYVFSPDNQADGANPVRIVSSNVVSNASKIRALTAGGSTAIWGINPQGNLFYTKCDQGNEEDTTAWSVPIPLVSSAEHFSFYTNLDAKNLVLFAHVSGQELLQLTQDPITTDWFQRQILLPATEVNDFVEYNAFTTRIQAIDENATQKAGIEISLTSVSPVSVFINHEYYVLRPSVPVTATSDETGAITIVQQAETLAAVSYNASLKSPYNGTIAINPASKAMATLSTITHKEALDAVTLTLSDGTKKPLVPPNVSDHDKEAAASALSQFSQISATLPSDGSRKGLLLQSDGLNRMNAPSSLETEKESPVLALALINSSERRLMLHDTSQKIHPLRLNRKAALTQPQVRVSFDSLLVEAGDFFRMIKHAVEDQVNSFKVVLKESGLYQAIAIIGNKIYSAWLDCKAAVAQACEFVLDKIRVGINELVAWLGFLFEWKSIVRTHRVMKNFIKQYTAQATGKIGTLETTVASGFDKLEDKLNTWVGITDPGTKIGTTMQSTSTGHDAPQSHWGLQQLKSNLHNAAESSVIGSIALGAADSVLSELGDFINDEEKIIHDTIDQVKTQIVEVFAGLTPVQVIQRLAGIIGDAVLKTAKSIVVKAIDLIKMVFEAVVNSLDAPIEIPIISPFYEKITGDKLSILDLMVLVAAIPATVIHKIITSKEPFPDNATTNALTSAKDWASLKNIIMPTKPTPKLLKANGSIVRAAAEGDTGNGDTGEGGAGDGTAGDGGAKGGGQADGDEGKPEEPSTVFKVFSIIANISNTFGAWSTAVFNFFKLPKLATGNELKRITKSTLDKLCIPSAVLFIFPNIVGAFEDSSEWQTIIDVLVAGLFFSKAVLDASPIAEKDMYPKVSPYVDFGINLIWLVPAIGRVVRHHDKQSSYVVLGACLAADLAGMLYPIFYVEKFPMQVRGAALAVSTGVNVCAGVLTIADAFLIGFNK